MEDSFLRVNIYLISDDVTLYSCVLYVPPENSSRNVDVNVFFDNLLKGVYEYQNYGIFLYAEILGAAVE